MPVFRWLFVAAVTYVEIISFIRFYRQDRVIDFLIANFVLVMGAAIYVLNNEGCNERA